MPLLAVAVVVAATLAACGSSGTGSGSPGGSSAAVAPSGSGTPADAATKAAIAKAYATLFGTTATLSQAEAAVQHGGKFAAAIKKESQSSFAKKSGARVGTATLVSPNTAKVTFSVLVGGRPLLKDEPGYAIKEHGTWKVAAKTFCGLLKLNGAAPSACDDPSVTALPH